MVPTFQVRPIFIPLWESKGKRYVIAMGGRGTGRSTAISQFMVTKLVSGDYMRAAIMRSVHEDIRLSSWKEITDRIEEQNLKNAKGFSMTDGIMRATYGANSINALGFRASRTENSAKLKSLAGYNVVWIEEAEEIGEEEFMKLDDSLRTVKGDILIILSLNCPPKNHWIITRWFDLISAVLDGMVIDGFFTPQLKESMREDVLFIGGTYRDNLQNLAPHTIKNYVSYRELKPHYYWNAIEGFVPETVRGKIYSGWRQIASVPFNARLIRRGLDFGWFPDPACLVDIYYHDGGYIVDELAYGTELSNEFLATVINAQPEKALVVADSAEPKSIAEIAGYSVQIIGAEKGKDSVGFGIQLISTMKISVTVKSKNVWDSYEKYAWKENKDGDPTGEPVHTYSHAMDAIRYPLVSLGPIERSENKMAEQSMRMNQNQFKNVQNDNR